MNTRTRLGPNPDQEALADALAAVRALLDALGQRATAPAPSFELPVRSGTSLARVARAFDLSSFELSVLVLAATVELLPGTDVLCGKLSGDSDRAWPSIGLALSVFPEPTWDAFTPSGSLRGNRLVTLGEGGVLTQRPLRVEERVLHALMGNRDFDPRLRRRLFKPERGGALPAAHEEVAKSAAVALQASGVRSVHLWGDAVDLGRAVAARACESAGKEAWEFDANGLPADAIECDELVRLWNREVGLGDVALIVYAPRTLDVAADGQLASFVSRLRGQVFVVAREAPSLVTQAIRIRVPSLQFEDQLEIWRSTLDNSAAPASLVRELSAQFRLGPAAVKGAALEVAAGSNGHARDAASTRTRLWRACCAQARPRMVDLAQRVDVRARLDQVVLPQSEREAIAAIISQVRRRATVHHSWGFSEFGSKDAGTSAVFAGPSGTGKSMCAEAIAHELDLDLFRIDLSAVVSKYIGETEENLRRVFDAAEAGGAILLFDEADALFGKRTDVRDSHDRHANIEVSYLLQRLEAFAGLAIMTTNLRKNIDDAFMRRVQFVVDFRFPDPAQRAEIWRGVFPTDAPQAALDPQKLGRLSVAGGNIRSIARNAAYLAADEEQAIGMVHVLRAARLEYAKLGRTVPSAEIRGWSSTTGGQA